MELTDMYRELLPILDEDIIALTANRRLSQHLRNEFDQYQIERQQKIWETPNILPLNTWLAQTWQQHPNGVGTLLTDFQEQLLWINIIRSSKYADLILHVPSTATLVKQAWRSLKFWDIPLSQLSDSMREETQIFLHWANQFKQIKEEKTCISSAELPNALTHLVQNNQLALPKKLILIGFDDLSPSIQTLLNHIKLKTQLVEFNPKTKITKIHRIQLADSETEILTMARWAKGQMLEKNHKKIGCIVPNLSNQRKTIVRIFQEVFKTETPFNISIGQPLNSYPMMQTALSVLQINHHRIGLEQLSTLLRSPYLNSPDQEACLAAQLDIEIRSQHQLTIQPATLRQYFTKVKHVYPKTSFFNRWEAFLKTYHEDARALPSQWAEWFVEELSQIGWPGQRSLNSDDYQLLKRWESLLKEFAHLDIISPALSRREAVRTLSFLLKQTIFQPQSQTVPIQILGLLEASGNEFDALWVMGLDNENWPSSAKPNPFLPIELQRRYKLPHASAERELQYSEQIQFRLFNSAPLILLSSAKKQDDKQLTPSRLIHSIPEIKQETLNLTSHKNNVEQVYESGKLESLDDNEAPCLQPDEVIQGGSWILQQQSLCPFRAFASVRLQAESLQEPQPGLSASERGILVHQALETIWKIIKTQDKLLTYSDSELQALIETTTHTIIEHYSSDQFNFLKIEEKRLNQLIKEWLSFEKTRPPFKVAQQETTRHIKINKLPLFLKIDRIDTLNDGTHLVIDYKTKLQNNIDHWFGHRPKDIQLPLYCSYGMHSASGLAYAQVKSGRMTFKGLMSDDQKDIFSEIITTTKLELENESMNWNQIIQEWRNVLQQLSVDFCSGKAEVDPIDPTTTCYYCDLQSLCRIGEKA